VHEYASGFTQARRQDLAAGGGKNQKEGPKTRRGSHIFKIQCWMYAATGGPNVKSGAPILNGGAKHHWPPAGDGPGFTTTPMAELNCSCKRRKYIGQYNVKICKL